MRGPVRRLRAEADIDLSQLQNACSEGLAVLVAAHAAMSAAASSRQQDLQEERHAVSGLLFPVAASGIATVGLELRQHLGRWHLAHAGWKAVLTCLGFWTLLRLWPVSILP